MPTVEIGFTQAEVDTFGLQLPTPAEVERMVDELMLRHIQCTTNSGSAVAGNGFCPCSRLPNIVITCSSTCDQP